MADQLAADRIRAAREHLTLVSQGDWDGVIATFRHARYEVYRTATIYDGEEAVRGYLNASRKIYPDLNHQIIAIAANDDIVLVEFWLKGTHLGPLLVGNKAYQALSAYPGAGDKRWRPSSRDGLVSSLTASRGVLTARRSTDARS